LSAPAAPESALAHSPVTVELDLSAPPVATPVKIAVAEISPPVVPVATNRAIESVSTAAPAIVPTAANTNTWWLVGGALGALLLLAIFWRMARRSGARAAVLVPVKSGRAMENSPAFPRGQMAVKQQRLTTATFAAATNVDKPTVINIAATGATQTQSENWQQRAQAAERRAEEAATALQTGLLPHLSRWLKEKFVHRLAADRAQLLETQRAAALKILAVDERLAKVETELKQRYRVYERRIDELLKELAVAKEENRELIRAKIALVKAEMEKERARAEQTRAD